MKISVILEALTGGFETDIKRAQKASEKAFAQMKKDAQSSNVAIGNFFTGATVAAGAVAAGIGYAVTSAVNEMDNLSKTAQKIGVTTEALSAMQYAAELADVDIGQLQGGMTRLVKAQAAVAEGSKKQAALFEALGVQVLNADGSLRNADQVMADLADRFAAMQDGSEKTAAAVAIFGRAGADLIPLLNGGAQGLREAAREAENFGLIVSTEAGRAAEEFNDNLTRMGNAIEGAGVQLATELLPVLNDLATRVVNMAKDPAFRSELAQAIKTVGEFAIDAAQGIVTMTNVLGFLWDEAKQFVGLVDPADLVRQYEKLDALRDQYAPFANANGTEAQTPQAQALRDEIAAVEANIAAQEKLLNTRSTIDSELQEVDLSTLPERRRTAAPALFRPVAEMPQSNALASRALIDAASAELEEIVRAYEAAASDVQAIRLGLLTDEERAISSLQAQYIELQNAVSVGAITQAEASQLSAQLAQDWADAQAEANAAVVQELYSGLLTQEEEIANSYERRRNAIIEATVLTEQQRQDALARLDKDYEQQMTSLSEKNMDSMSEFAKAAAQNMQSAFADFLFDPFSDGVDGMLLDFVNVLRRMAAEAVAAKIFEAIGGAMGGASGGTGGAFASLFSAFAGAKDSGGSIPSGSWALVGERRPELVAGPATVIGGAQTGLMLQQSSGQKAQANVRVVNAIDPAFIADYLASPAGDQVYLNLVSRNSRKTRSLVGG